MPYTPTIQNYPSGIVSIASLDSTSYNMILNSMGSHSYLVKKGYLKTESNSQILEGFEVFEYDSNGNQLIYSEKPLIDPKQSQKSLFFKFNKESVVLNGNTSFNMNILPNEKVFLVLYTYTISNGSFLNDKGLLGDGFFNEYRDEL